MTRNSATTAKLPPSVSLTLRINPRMSRLLLLLLILPLVTLLTWLAAPQLHLFEERLSELRWVAYPQQTEEHRFVLLTIDEAALQRLGAWPWSRETLAEIAATLQQAGASQQIYDLILPEAKPGDDHLAAQLQRSNALLAIIPLLQKEQNLQTGQTGTPLPGIQCRAPLPGTTQYLGNAPAYSGVAVGHIAPLVDRDGIIRKQPPLVCINGKAYPSLTLAALLQAQQQPGSLQLQPGKGLLQPHWWLTDNNGLLQLPLDQQANLRLSYHQAPESFTILSITDLLDGNYPAEQLHNAWVLIGATAFGLGDVVPTPHAALTPGVELQARLLSALLDQQHTYQPQGAWLHQLLQMLLMGGLLLLLAEYRQHNVPLLAAAAAALPLAQLGLHWLILPHGLWLGWLLPAIYSLTAATALLLLEFTRTRFERQRLYLNLSSYLPRGIADEIAFHQPSGSIQGKYQQLLVICADLRNFSRWQQQLPAEETAALLHYFFTCANRSINKHGGTLHEYRGDALLAAWPMQPGKEQQNLNAALQMIKDLQQQMHDLLQEAPHEGLEPLGLDFGLDSGSVLVGSIGSPERRSHILLGETVTRVLRIQQLATEFGCTLLLGEQAAHLLPHHSVKSQGSYLLEGLTIPRQLYTLSNTDTAAPQHQDKILQLHPRSG